MVEEKKSKLKSVPDNNRRHQLPCLFFSSVGGTEVGLINADVTEDTTLHTAHCTCQFNRLSINSPRRHNSKTRNGSNDLTPPGPHLALQHQLAATDIRAHHRAFESQLG